MIYNLMTQVVLIIGMLGAFVLGYRAGRKEEAIIRPHIPDMDIINTEELGPALESDEEIRKNMEESRKVIIGE
jgi:hypothetical protein